ncbi:MAG: PKD domain-containing protein [Candidatus Sigynarchaeota archaeon]
MIFALNWSSSVFFGFFAAGLVYLPMAIVMLRIYAKWKARYAILWALIIMLGIGYNIMSCLGSIFSMDVLGTLGIVSLFSSNFLIVLFIDSVNRDTVDPLKIGVIAMMWAITSIAFIISITPEPFNLLVATNLIFDIIAAPCALVTLFLPGSLVLYHGTRILKHVPGPLKPYAGLFVFGGIMIIFTSLLSLSDITILEGLGLSGFVMIAAIASITIAFARQPKLAYVLPFKAYRLTVFDTTGGTPIYNHTWQPSREQVDETLFSGMLQGVGAILNESLNQGNVREISLDKGTMILQRFHGSANSTARNPVHAYTTVGRFDVTVTITDGDGDIATFTRSNYIYVDVLPVANFTASATTITSLGSVTFTFKGYPGNDPASYT